MDSRLDIILFGASGFTGKHCISELNKLTKSDKSTIKWGVAGRSESKLRDVLSEYTTKTDLSSVPIIIADVNNYNSIVAMTARAKIIINCCGPYRFYGEPIIKACLETGTHQVDVTGEPQYMEYIQLNYHKAAQEKGIYIVSACGFDSIPADLGILYMQNNFQGTLNSVETYINLTKNSSQTSGSSINYTTWESAVYGFAHAAELREIRRKLYPTPLPNFLPKLKSKPAIHKSELIDAWCVPFMGSDRSVALRSQRYLYEKKNIRPVQVQCYVGVSLFNLILLLIYGTLFSFLAKYEFGRNLLLKHPKLFSAGVVSHEPPSEKKLNETKLSMTFYGKGWDDKIPANETECSTQPDKVVVGCASCINPGYGITCSAVVLCANTILTETDKLPDRGGVYTPAAAFADTTLTDQLQKNGLNFEIFM